MSGNIILTFDFELGWGSIENGLWQEREKRSVYDNLRPTMKRLLKALTDLEIPATWAVVAGMLDTGALDNLDHLPQPLRDQSRKALRAGRQSTFDGRDLADLLVSSGMRLASHSFCHMRFSFPGITAETVDAELTRCEAVWRRWQKKIDTFVFPQNQEGFHDVLRRHGITKARANEHGPTTRTPLQRAWASIVAPPPLSRSTTRDGVALESGSLLFKVPPKEEFFRLPLLRTQLERGLRLAQKKSGTLHVYLHPFNLAESPALFASFLAALEYIASQRDQGLLHIGTF